MTLTMEPEPAQELASSTARVDADALAAMLRETPPSPITAAQLGALDRGQLSPAGRVDALAVLERHIAWLQALQAGLLADIATHAERTGGVGVDDPNWAVEEVACALRLANSTAADRLHIAELLSARHPKTLELLGDGAISYQQARAMADLCEVLPVSTAGEVEAMMADTMPRQAAGQTRAAVRRAILKADPEGAQARHEQRRRDRETVHYPHEDGMAFFGALLPAQQTAQMEQAVDAHAATFEDDGRTLPQKRADALYDLVVNQPRQEGSSATPGSPRAIIQVTVDFDTLLGADDEPAELKGYGPITADQARDLAFAPGTVWRRLLTRPATGQLIKADATTYRPTAETARHVRARDRECAFPSCHMPAQRCDVDHVIPFDHEHPERGGPTVPDNLQPLCRRHHRLKTHAKGWTVTRSPSTGTTTWTTPTGHTYANTPRRYRE
ncbi:MULTISPECIES: HNH endonuclease signature motif containing protein [unclassified Streptomyces]|uniref:HNH endonuclease signature motif containing protein n=1 Tax=unclassified Streptomyces TaxID=2593676 RepID=UPI0019290BB1|nr:MULTISPECIES: HNH endonuclease signature motif containing protein [unclassified Streptomyces]